MATFDVESIPVLDVSCVSGGIRCDEDDPEQDQLARDLIHALSTVGFVYLRGHGIQSQQVEDVMRESARFFELPDEKKASCARKQEKGNHGWVKSGEERLNPERPGDLKEAFNLAPAQFGGMFWPEEVAPSLQPTLTAFYSACRVVAERLLVLMAKGLDLEDKNYFLSRHHPDKPSNTTLRSLYYPQVMSQQDLKPGQLRCGEHSDYGSLTLLFQDEVGGLEVLRRDGKYVQACPIPGTVVVNIGDLMQRWTADRLLSTKHRVVALTGGDKPRQSLACFFHPDMHCEIRCADGSDKYPPTTDAKYIAEKFKASYG